MNKIIHKYAGLIAIIICFLVGSGLLVNDFFLIKGNLKLKETGVKTIGQVVGFEVGNDNGPMYYPVVNFKDETGQVKEFISPSGSYPASYKEGEDVSILYNPTNPNDAKIDNFFSFWLVPILFSVFGGGTILAGLIILALMIIKNKHHHWLAKNGADITATIIGSRINESLDANGHHPFVITAQWQNPRDKKIYTFSSNAIWFDPAPYLDTKKEVAVRINPRNPRIYLMDTSFLPISNDYN